MWSLDGRACAILAQIALASLAGIATTDARGESPRMHEQRPSGVERQSVRREMPARQSRGSHPAFAQDMHGAAQGATYPARQHPVTTYHQTAVARSIEARRTAVAGVTRENQLAARGRVGVLARGPAAGPVHVVRYGNSLSGTVERTIRPGLVSRTFVSGGQVLYSHVYQRHVWYQFGRPFAYETFVPAVRYPAVYYAWALAPWPRPITYAWGWQVQPWYPVYGPLFTPYPVYSSPDLWMTDYIIAQNMQAAYQAQTAPRAPQPSPQTDAAAPAPDPSGAVPARQTNDVPPVSQPSDAPSAEQSSQAPVALQSSDTSSAPTAPPPALTPQVKAQLNAQIKVRLQEQQVAAVTPATLTTQSTPPALRPTHVFFEVVQPIDVPTANGHCSLSANDYIKRTGGMSSDDWMIPVVVELSRPSDCPEGLQTRIGLNDLNAMENEQEAQVMEAMRAASKGMGPNGPPSGVHPTLIVDGSATPDPMALDALRHAQ
jgi:hypothetical protein